MCDKLYFFRSGKLLDGPLPPKGGGLVRQLLPIDQLQRPPATGVFGPLALTVGLQPPLHIIGGAGIEGAVAAAEYV